MTISESTPSTSGLKRRIKMTDGKQDNKGKDKENKNKKQYFCSSCNEPYQSPPREDWIQCCQCKNWCHELCSSYLGVGSYYCDFCNELTNYD